MRGERDGGAAAVEFALVLVPLLLVVFGIIEYGLYFADSINLRQAARDGARQGSVANWGTTSSCGLAFGVGSVPSDDVKKLMCQVHSNSTVATAPVAVKVRFVNFSNADTTYSASNLNVVMRVCVLSKHDGITGLVPFPSSAFIKSKVDMLIEKSSALVQTAGQETPVSGGDWTWC